MKALGWTNVFQILFLGMAMTLLVSCGEEKDETEVSGTETETTSTAKEAPATEAETATEEITTDSAATEVETTATEEAPVEETEAAVKEETTTSSTKNETASTTTTTTKVETKVEEVQEVVEEVKAAGPAKMQFEEKEFQFGTIDQGDVVEHTFKFKNVGESPLVITNARGSCGCTVPEWPKGEIQAGDTDEIFVKFNSRGKRGAQTKSVTLTTNYGTEVIYIKGKVNVPESN